MIRILGCRAFSCCWAYKNPVEINDAKKDIFSTLQGLDLEKSKKIIEKWLEEDKIKKEPFKEGWREEFRNKYDLHDISLEDIVKGITEWTAKVKIEHESFKKTTEELY